MRHLFQTIIILGLGAGCTQKFDFGHIEDAAWTLYGYRHIETLSTQTDSLDNPVNIALVIDNSGSTQSIHSTLSAGLDSFLDQLKNKNVALRVYTTTNLVGSLTESCGWAWPICRPSLAIMNDVRDKDLPIGQGAQYLHYLYGGLDTSLPFFSSSYLPFSVLSANGGVHTMTFSIGPGIRVVPTGINTGLDNMTASEYPWVGGGLNISESFVFTKSMSNFDAIKGKIKETILNLDDKGHPHERGLEIMGHLLNGKSYSQVPSAYQFFKPGERGALIFFSDENDETVLAKDENVAGLTADDKANVPLTQVKSTYGTATAVTYQVKLKHKKQVRTIIWAGPLIQDNQVISEVANNASEIHSIIYDTPKALAANPGFDKAIYPIGWSATLLKSDSNAAVRAHWTDIEADMAFTLGLRNKLDPDSTKTIANSSYTKGVRAWEYGVDSVVTNVVRVPLSGPFVNMCENGMTSNGMQPVVTPNSALDLRLRGAAMPVWFDYAGSNWYYPQNPAGYEITHTFNQVYEIVGCEMKTFEYGTPVTTTKTSLAKALDPTADDLLSAMHSKIKSHFGDNRFFVGAAVLLDDQADIDARAPGECGHGGSTGTRYIDFIEDHKKLNPGLGGVLNICDANAYKTVLDQVSLFTTRVTALTENKVTLKPLESAIAVRIKHANGKYSYPKLLADVSNSGAKIDGDQIFVHPSELVDGDKIEVLIEKALESSTTKK